MKISARFVLLICLLCWLSVTSHGPARGVSGAITGLG